MTMKKRNLDTTVVMIVIGVAILVNLAFLVTLRNHHNIMIHAPPRATLVTCGPIEQGLTIPKGEKPYQRADAAKIHL